MLKGFRLLLSDPHPILRDGTVPDDTSTAVNSFAAGQTTIASRALPTAIGLNLEDNSPTSILLPLEVWNISS
ncbi:hypothetical protein ACFQZR_25475 [Paenibacillus sp. GCM10027629]|uniref:hypothetical protein n=1 Tax=Paenibacillus sp. GCM10027629 TaxID=3273414 RepID=UPI0036256F14